MTPPPDEAARDAGCWRLPLADATVTQCRFDHAVTLVISAGLQQSYELRIEEAFVLTMEGAEVTLALEGDPTAMAPALGLLHRTVEQAVAHDDGRLELRFAGGAAVRVAGGDRYEAWEIVGPGGFRFVSLPGGELAIWDAA